MGKYPETVKAALSETRSKFALAEALWNEIPERHRGPSPDEDANIPALLAEAREAIIAAGGEAKEVETLAKYRYVAKWVFVGTDQNFRWIKGLSFTSHLEARHAYGPDGYETFAADPKNAREIRLAKNKAQPGPKDVTQYLSPEQKAQVGADIATSPDPEVASLTQSKIAEAETHAAAKALAAVTKRTVEEIERDFAPDLRRVRDTARSRAERRGTPFAAEVDEAAKYVLASSETLTTATPKEKKAKVATDPDLLARRAVIRNLSKAAASLHEAIGVKVANWESDEKEVALSEINAVRSALLRIEAKVTGTEIVNWDNVLGQVTAKEGDA